MVELIRRSLRYLGGPLVRKLFTTFLRPHLVYGQVIWAPYLKQYVTILENEQRHATKLVNGFHRLSYSERLRKLNLLSLIHRKARGNMIELFKHFHFYDNFTVPEIPYLKSVSVENPTSTSCGKHPKMV